MTEPRPLNEHEQRLLQNVSEHGCGVISVFDPDGEQPSFSYSVGFPETISQPEVIVVGLPSDLSGFMINELLRQGRDGLVLTDWISVDGLLDGFVCILRAIPPHRIEAEYFNSAMWFERRRSGEDMTAAFQIVWPGAVHGLFPWEEGADFYDEQPALYEPRLSS